ncbi:uncharacterized protein LOC117902676 [Drosophila subobscura]|uniref:uncharacterized protein LOC117902676 n=1 Tax=Drosophila subobscura TaxID=7241 RepID=UPI00155A60B1|nr:uncharacterized protein LOC117902676 [Drosophila subobscura]
MPSTKWILLLQTLLIFYAFYQVTCGIKEEIKKRLLKALSKAGYTLKFIGTTGEALGDAIIHGSRLPKAVYDIVRSLFKKGELEIELEAQWKAKLDADWKTKLEAQKKKPVCEPADFKCKILNIFGMKLNETKGESGG